VATDTRDATPRSGTPARPARATRRRTTPLQFYREIIAELRKVIYPSRTELVTYVAVVLVFVSAMVAVVASIDFGLTKAVLAIFG
jgi:preprotein translocase subunit SecE